ncbi:putative late blight resistance protein-like protein R1A-4 [Forsythia ovata]|uniref:Late blight resistance protein-like protein R1A-4 n=1 Tax=Forsythia ovata TaxID=205694 RepID=A0ABD1TQ56_9LAMI
MTVVGSLSNLEVLKFKFHAFECPVWELNDGEFCRLKLLLIHMTDVEHWKVDKTHLPSLQRQCLRYYYNLVEIPSGIGKIPTLEEIELCECKTSIVTSAQVIQEEKESLGNNGFKSKYIILDRGLNVMISYSIICYDNSPSYIRKPIAKRLRLPCKD